MSPTANPREILKTLRWIQRAKGLLAELDRHADSADVAAVRAALSAQLQIEQSRLTESSEVRSVAA